MAESGTSPGISHIRWLYSKDELTWHRSYSYSHSALYEVYVVKDSAVNDPLHPVCKHARNQQWTVSQGPQIAQHCVQNRQRTEGCGRGEGVFFCVQFVVSLLLAFAINKPCAVLGN